MLTLPNAIVPVLHPFATLFRNPTWRKVTVQTWWVELGEGGLPKAGGGGGGYVIYRAWILKWT